MERTLERTGTQLPEVHRATRPELTAEEEREAAIIANMFLEKKEDDVQAVLPVDYELNQPVTEDTAAFSPRNMLGRFRRAVDYTRTKRANRHISASQYESATPPQETRWTRVRHRFEGKKRSVVAAASVGVFAVAAVFMSLSPSEGTENTAPRHTTAEQASHDATPAATLPAAKQIIAQDSIAATPIIAQKAFVTEEAQKAIVIEQGQSIWSAVSAHHGPDATDAIVAKDMNSIIARYNLDNPHAMQPGDTFTLAA